MVSIPCCPVDGSGALIGSFANWMCIMCVYVVATCVSLLPNTLHLPHACWLQTFYLPIIRAILPWLSETVRPQITEWGGVVKVRFGSAAM